MKEWTRKNKYWFLLGSFIICVLIYTVFGRSERISDNRLDLFWSYREAFVYGNGIMLREIILNVAMLAPLGYMLSCALGEKYSDRAKLLFSAIIGVITSSMIELGQYFLFRGTAELDDVIDNTLGTILGCVLHIVLKRIKSNNFNIDRLSNCIAVSCVVIAIVACAITDDSSDGASRQLAFQANHVYTTDKILHIDGFCFTYGYDLINHDTKPINVAWDDSNYEILLKSEKTGDIIPMESTINIEKPSVNEYFKSIYEYPKTGFEASIGIDELELTEEYEILLKSGRLTLSGETFIKEGKIVKTPKKENINLDVEGTYLEEIVNNGYLKAHKKDNSCIIYQYGKYLYWITNGNYKFSDYGTTRIEYQIWSTQLDRVPKNIIEENRNWVDLGFIFEKKEITSRMDCGKYRVAVMELPTKYSIAFIITGSYKDGTWEWYDIFRPRY